MGSKSIFLLCLFLAISTLLVISEVAARDLAETSTSEKKTEVANGLKDAKYGGYGPGNGGYGPGNGGYGPGNGGYGPGNGGYGPGNGGYGPGNGGYGPGNGGYGPGNGGYGPGNGGYGPGRGGYGPGRGGYCRFGCCRREYYGRGCRRCCYYAGEAAVTEQPQAKPNN